MIYGNYRLLDDENPRIYAYPRALDERKLLILLNFSESEARFNEGSMDLSKARMLIGNYPNSPRDFRFLRPFEALVLEL